MLVLLVLKVMPSVAAELSLKYRTAFVHSLLPMQKAMVLWFISSAFNCYVSVLSVTVNALYM